MVLYGGGLQEGLDHVITLDQFHDTHGSVATKELEVNFVIGQAGDRDKSHVKGSDIRHSMSKHGRCTASSRKHLCDPRSSRRICTGPVRRRATSMAETWEEVKSREWFLHGFLVGRLRGPTGTNASDSSAVMGISS